MRYSIRPPPYVSGRIWIFYQLVAIKSKKHGHRLDTKNTIHVWFGPKLCRVQKQYIRNDEVTLNKPKTKKITRMYVNLSQQPIDRVLMLFEIHLSLFFLSIRRSTWLYMKGGPEKVITDGRGGGRGSTHGSNARPNQWPTRSDASMKLSAKI